MNSHPLRRKYSWANLPPELLETIFDRLDSHLRTCSLRPVCKKWYSLIPPPSFRMDLDWLPFEIHFPYSEFFNRVRFSDQEASIFVLVPTTVFLLRPRHGETSNSNSDTKSWLIGLEQPNDMLRLTHPLTGLAIDSEDIPENFPKTLCTNFYYTSVSKGYTLKYVDGITPVLERNKTKELSLGRVVLWQNPNSQPFSEAPYSVMLLHHAGDLMCFSLSGHKRLSNITHSHVYKFDDIEFCNFNKWKGMMLAIDRVGRLYGIEYNTRNINTVIVANSVRQAHTSERRKRLLVSNSEVYLVIRTQSIKHYQFMVYKLDQKNHQWEGPISFEDQVLFISFDACFFVPVKDLPGYPGNLVVFPKNCFPTYSGSNSPDNTLFRDSTSSYLEVGAVYSRNYRSEFKLITSMPGISDLLWPPPQWFLNLPTSSPYYRPYTFGSDQEEQLEVHNQSKHAEMLERLLGKAYGVHLQKFALTRDVPVKIGKADSLIPHITIIKPYVKNNGDSTIRFQEMNIRADLVPVLEKIEVKYVDVTEGSLVTYRGNVARALESLAEVVLILQNNTGRSLKKSHVVDLRAVLLDLQRLRFKVEWLVPFVDKAIECYRTRRVTEILAKKTASNSQAFGNNTSDAISLDECLGKGLC